MNNEMRKALWISSAVHGLAIVWLVVAAAVTIFCKNPPHPHVFQLVGSPNGAAAKHTAKMPSFSPPPASAMPAALAEPEPPAPEPVTEALPPPPIPQPKVHTATPAPIPPHAVVIHKKTAPPSPREKIDYSAFVKKYGKKSTAKHTAQPRPAAPSSSAQSFNTQAAKQAIRDWASQAGAIGSGVGEGIAGTTAALSALEQYIQSLYARINAVWQKPPGSAGRNLSSQVEFHARPDGSLSMRITASSGNAAFDRSIQDAFQRLGRLQVPREATNYTFALTFRETNVED